ncbi:MAG: STAS domain-containing protein [Actinomycetota bacterium]
MQYQVNASGSEIRVSLRGELNFLANEDFQRFLLEVMPKASGMTVVIDLAGIGRMDSVGLGLLYIAKEEFAGIKAPVVLARPADAVFRLLELTDAGKSFEIRR